MSSLISVSELKQRLATVVVLDCQSDLMNRQHSHQLYIQQHIAGAHYLHLEEDLSGTIVAGKTGRHPLPSQDQLQRLLRRLGLETNTEVVVYDQSSSMFAARAWWLLKWAGLTSVRVLDGGLKAWLAAAGKVSSKPAEARPASAIEVSCPADWLIDHQGISAAGDQILLLDARAKARYLGDNEPLDAKAGHIPGAGNADFMANLTKDHQFRPSAELQQRFAPVQASAKPAVCYCGSGVTACHNILAMTEAGLPWPRLYAGSWSEWCLDDSRPIATAEEGVQL